jgi:hypothetical protein
MLEQHPVPQNVTSFQFRLIGDMTLKQFAYLAGGAILAYISWSLPLPFFFRYPIAAIFGLGGIGFAFVPVEERPMDVWFVSFVRSIYSPTQYLWQREEKHAPPVAAAPMPGQAVTASPAKTTGMMIPSVLPADSITKLITQFTDTLQRTATTMKQKKAYTVPKATPQPVVQKPVSPPIAQKPLSATPTPPVQAPPPQQHKEEPQGKAQAAPPQQANRPTFQTVVVPQVPGITSVAQNKPPTFVTETVPLRTPVIQQKTVAQPPIVKPTEQPQRITPPVQQPVKPVVNMPVQQQHATQAPQQNTQLEQRLKQMEAQLQQHGVDQQRLKDLEAKLELATAEKQKLEELVKRQTTTQPPVPQHTQPAPSPVVVQPPQPQKPTVSVFTPQGARSAGIPTITTFANVVSGIVRERNGNLLVGVLVTVKDKEDVPVRALKTNKLGQFAASTPLLNGTYTLEVEDPKRQFTFDQARVILQGNVLPPLEIIAKSQQELERAKLEQAVFGKKDVT